MRTTLNIDEDVAAELIEEARRRGRSRSRVANELMRAGLRVGREVAAPEPYEAPTFDTGTPLIEVTDVAAALEVLDRDR